MLVGSAGILNLSKSRSPICSPPNSPQQGFDYWGVNQYLIYGDLRPNFLRIKSQIFDYWGVNQHFGDLHPDFLRMKSGGDHQNWRISELAAEPAAALLPTQPAVMPAKKVAKVTAPGDRPRGRPPMGKMWCAKTMTYIIDPNADQPEPKVVAESTGRPRGRPPAGKMWCADTKTFVDADESASGKRKAPAASPKFKKAKA
ncbi:hypothetical protein T492DRAFT_1138890 [Pavlovales sp. CCMP2436]|nr:hypothetical protein T492DRAFT_1138890 [Pavlovales sp. CCMP2436]